MRYLLLLIFVPLPSCLTLDFNFKQSVYNLTVDMIETKWWSKSVFKSFRAETRSLRRGAISIEVSFETIVLVSKMKLRCTSFKRINGHYVDTSIGFTVDVGDVCKKNYFGMKKTCDAANIAFPMQPGLYNVKDLVFDASRFPPHFPGGSYKVEMGVIMNDTKSAEMHVYGSVIYPKLYSGVQ